MYSPDDRFTVTTAGLAALASAPRRAPVLLRCVQVDGYVGRTASSRPSVTTCLRCGPTLSVGASTSTARTP